MFLDATKRRRLFDFPNIVVVMHRNSRLDGWRDLAIIQAISQATRELSIEGDKTRRIEKVRSIQA